jgi:hypothetical protein
MKKVMIVRTNMPSRQDVIQMASVGLAAGKLSNRDAQAVERLANANRVLPADLLHRVREGTKK